MEAVGDFTFEYIVVRPFRHPNLRHVLARTYWSMRYALSAITRHTHSIYESFFFVSIIRINADSRSGAQRLWS